MGITNLFILKIQFRERRVTIHYLPYFRLPPSDLSLTSAEWFTPLLREPSNNLFSGMNIGGIRNKRTRAKAQYLKVKNGNAFPMLIVMPYISERQIFYSQTYGMLSLCNSPSLFAFILFLIHKQMVNGLILIYQTQS